MAIVPWSACRSRETEPGLRPALTYLFSDCILEPGKETERGPGPDGSLLISYADLRKIPILDGLLSQLVSSQQVRVNHILRLFTKAIGQRLEMKLKYHFV